MITRHSLWVFGVGSAVVAAEVLLHLRISVDRLVMEVPLSSTAMDLGLGVAWR